MKRFFTRQIRLIGRVVSEFAAFVRFVVGFAYLLVARSFFYVMALYLVVYFTVSTSHFTRFLNNLVSDTMPGRLYFGQVIWGPMPWRVQVFFFSATPPDDEPAIRARYVDTSMNLRRLIVSLLSNALWNDNLLDLYFEETTVHDSETRLVFDDQMNFIFLNTWNDRSPGVGDGTFVRVTMPDIKLVRGSVHLRFPFATIDVDLDDLTSKLYVDGDRVKVYGPTINIRRGSMQFFPGTAEARKKPLRFDWRQMRISSFFTDGRMIRIDKGHGFFPRSGINFSGFINVDDPLSFDLQTELDLRSDDVLVRQFIGDQLKGPLRAKFRLHGTLDDVAAVLDLKSPTLSVTGLSVAALALKGRFQKDYWVNPLGEYAYHIDSLSGKMLGGTLKVEKAVYKPSWTVTKSAKPKRRGKKPGRPVPIGTIVDGFQIKGRLTNVRLDALARYLASRARLGAERKLVERFPFLSGTLNGTIDLTRNRLSHTMTAGLNLKVQQERARAFLARTYSVIGDVGLLFRDPGTSGLDLDPTHWRVTANRLRLISGRDRLQLSGWFDWVDETADLRFSGEIARLRDLLAHFGRRDVSGRLLIQDGRLLGRWENPSVSLRAQIDDAEYGETKLGQVKGRVRIRNGLLAADNVVLLPKWAKRLGGNLTIKLYDASIFKISESFPVTLHRFEAQRLDLRLFDRRIPLEGPIDISNVTLSTTLSRFWPNLRLSGRFDGRTLTAMGERIRLVRGEFRITRDALDLDQFELFVGIAGQRLAGRAHYDRRKHDVDVTFNVRKFNLRTLRTVRHQRVPLFGVVSFNLRATGNVDQIRLSGSAEFDKLRYDSFNLGSARIRLVDRGPLKTAIVADRFFHDLRLLPGAMLRFSGRYPVGLKATVATQEKKPLDLRELLPNLKKRFTQAKLSARTELDVDFRRSQPLSARIMLPNKGLFVEIENVALLNTNQKPAGLSFERGALIIRGLDLLSIPVSIYRDGTLSKALEKRVLSIDGTLDRNGQLDFNLKGRADLAVLRTFKWISSIRGTADTRIKVSGTFDNPIPTGTLTFRDVHVVPRGFGREIRLADGALVRIGPGAKRGWQRIWIADDNRIKGGIDEGTFQFSGWLELKRWTPTNVEWKLNGSDIFYQVPGEYRVTFNPDIAFRGTKILDKENQQMELGGSVRITEGEYNKSFAQFTESFSQLLGASRKTTQYSKPLAEIFPWIDGVKLNLQIFGQNNFFIRSRLNFGKTNLEIRSNVNLGGSYGSPRVSGRISVLEGTLQYGIINRVFEIDRGTIDFSGDPKTPRIDVTARTEVTYEWTKSSSRRISLEEELLEGEEVTVNVLIHISGVFPKLNVRFSTDGSRGRYSQAQLISLVTFGYPDSGTGSVLGFNLTQEVFSLVPKLVLGAFVDELSLGLSEQLGVKISLVKRFGRTLKFKTQVTQTGEESKYQAGFQFKLTDRLSLEGRFRINRKDNTQKYDGKLKYRIPLD